jgi:hypothetical protein
MCTAFLASIFSGGSALAQCNFDVDANGSVDALTDGLLIIRAAFGLTGAALTNGAIGQNPTRSNPTDVLTFINANKSTKYDLDGNGSFDALTDGLMILRYLFGLTGPSVVNGATATDAVRKDWTAVSAFLQNGCTSVPACTNATVKNYLSWCSVSVNGNAPSPAAQQTFCVPQGQISLSAAPLTGFELSPSMWHGTTGDNGAGEAGVVTGNTSTAMLAVGATPACAWVCCPFAGGTGCAGVPDQCP